MDLLITLTKVTDVVRKLHSGKAFEVDEIYPEYLRSLDTVRLSLLAHTVSSSSHGN